MGFSREQLIREALEADPNDPLVHFAAGAFYDSERRFEEAVAAYRHAVQLNDQYSAAWLGLARACSALDEEDDARAAYQAAIEAAQARGDLKVRNEAQAELEQPDEF